MNTDAPSPVWSEWASGAAMATAWAAVLATAILGLNMQDLAIGGVAAYLAFQLCALRKTTLLHLGVGATLCFAVATLSQTPLDDLRNAAFRGSFIMVLFASLGMLQAAITRNPAFVSAGTMLVRQPPGRRYFALSGGTALFGAVLNFGVLPLMGGLVKAAQGDPMPPDMAKRRERRMMLSLLRGFSVVMFWCPLTVAFAITTTTIAGADWRLMMGAGLTLAAMVIGMGRFFDTAPRPAQAPASPQPFQWSALTPVFALLILLSALAAMIDYMTSGDLVHGVILFVPLTAIALFLIFERAQAYARITGYLSQDVPLQRNEVAVLGNAALSGTLIASLLPQQALLTLLGEWLPVAIIPALCLWAVVLLGQVGLNPLISVAALSAILTQPQALGLNPSLLALAFVTGWGLAVGSTSAAAATMLVGRLVGESAWTIGSRWNGHFTLAASLLTGGVITALALLLAT